MTYTVVIPCYNGGEDVREAVASALAQTYPPLEVLCVDDGSTDGSLRVLRELEAAHPDTVRVIAKTNGGAPSARNAGLHEAQGEWIQFLDADDLLKPEKVAHQLRLVEEAAFAPDLVGAAHDIQHLDGQIGHGVVEAMDPLCAVVLHCMGVTSANLFRRAAVVAAGGWNEAMPCSQEYELMFRMVREGAHVVFDPEPLTVIRERAGSTGKHEEALRVNMLFRRDVLRVYAERPPEAQDSDEWQRMLDSVFRWIRMNVDTQPEVAAEMFHEVLPRTFVPTPGGNTTRAYTMAFRMLGFERTERARRLLGRARRWNAS